MIEYRFSKNVLPRFPLLSSGNRLMQDKEAKDKEGNLITSKDKEGNPIPCHGNMKWKEADTLDLAKCEAPGAYLHVIEGKPEGM